MENISHKQTIPAIAIVALSLIIGIFLLNYNFFKVEWKNYSDACMIAKKSNKKMLVMFYAKSEIAKTAEAEKKLFNNYNVNKVISADYIPVKIDLEANTTIQFDTISMPAAVLCQQMNVQELPAFAVFDNNSRPITPLPAKMDNYQATKLLKFIGNETYKTTSFVEFLVERKLR